MKIPNVLLVYLPPFTERQCSLFNPSNSQEQRLLSIVSLIEKGGKEGAEMNGGGGKRGELR